jgi:hypothetical protein
MLLVLQGKQAGPIQMQVESEFSEIPTGFYQDGTE